MTQPAPASGSRVIGFIVGTSRGGTTFMNKVLNLHPEVASFGESSFFGRAWLEPAGTDGQYTLEQSAEQIDRFERARWGPDQGEIGCIASNIGQRDPQWAALLRELAANHGLPQRGGTPRELFELLCEAICRANNKRVAVEKTPHHLGNTDRIEACYPDARYILMLRRPYAFARSHKNQGRQFSVEQTKRSGRNYHPIVIALLWRGYASQALRLMSRCPERVLSVSLEELRENEAQALERVQRHLGLEPVELAGRVPPDNSSAQTQGGVSKVVPSRHLSAGERFWLNVFAKQQMKALGIVPEPAGLAASAPWYIVTLPFWALRNAAHYRRLIRGSLLRYAMRYLRPR